MHGDSIRYPDGVSEGNRAACHFFDVAADAGVYVAELKGSSIVPDLRWSWCFGDISGEYSRIMGLSWTSKGPEKGAQDRQMRIQYIEKYRIIKKVVGYNI